MARPPEIRPRWNGAVAAVQLPFDPQFQQSPALSTAEIESKEDDPCPLQIARRPDADAY